MQSKLFNITIIGSCAGLVFLGVMITLVVVDSKQKTHAQSIQADLDRQQEQLSKLKELQSDLDRQKADNQELSRQLDLERAKLLEHAENLEKLNQEIGEAIVEQRDQQAKEVDDWQELFQLAAVRENQQAKPLSDQLRATIADYPNKHLGTTFSTTLNLNLNFDLLHRHPATGITLIQPELAGLGSQDQLKAAYSLGYLKPNRAYVAIHEELAKQILQLPNRAKVEQAAKTDDNQISPAERSMINQMNFIQNCSVEATMIKARLKSQRDECYFLLVHSYELLPQ